MNIYQLGGVCICAAFAAVMLKNASQKENGLGVSSAVTIIIAAAVIVRLTLITGFISASISRVGVTSDIIIPMKAMGIAYSAQLSSELCRDAGESSIAGNIELIAKLEIIAISLPLAQRLLELGFSIIDR